MANWFEDEINHVGARLEKAIEKAGAEIQQQRSMTKSDMEDLIRFAADQFGATLDRRIEKAKTETSGLVTIKLLEFRSQLNEAAQDQKRTAVRNAAVGVVAATLVSLISLLSKKQFAGEVNIMDIYRTIMMAIAGGYFAVIAFKLARRYFSAPQMTRNAIITGASYLEVLKPKGLGIHVIVFLVAIMGWAILNKAEFIINLLNTLHK